MPEAVIVAGVTAAGALAGSALSSRATNRASGIQARSLQEALTFEREKEAEDRRRYEEQQALLKAQWDAEQERRRPFREAAERLIRGRGGSVPSRSAGMPVGWTPGAAQASRPSFSAPSRAFTERTPSSNLSMGSPVPAMFGQPQGGSPYGWGEWSRYGL